MSRCGCTSPCPACPQSVYLDHLVIPPGVDTFITLDLTTVPTTFTLVTRQINIAAGLPGFGFTSLAEWNAGAGGDQNFLTAAWMIMLDGALMQARSKLNWESDEWESMSVFTGRNNLAPGDHTIVFQIIAFMTVGTGQLFIGGAAMRTELVRADNLVVTGP